MQTIAGRWIGLEQNNKFTDCETECNFSFNVDMLPAASNETEPGYNSFIPGYTEWETSVSGKLLLDTSEADFKTLVNYARNKTRIKVSISTKKDSTLSIWGYGYVDSGSLMANSTEKANWNVTIKGDGAFYMDSDPYQLIINAMPAPADKPNIVDTRNW